MSGRFRLFAPQDDLSAGIDVKVDFDRRRDTLFQQDPSTWYQANPPFTYQAQAFTHPRELSTPSQPFFIVTGGGLCHRIQLRPRPFTSGQVPEPRYHHIS